MTVTPIRTAPSITAAPTQPALVRALVAIADHRGDMATDEWDAVCAGFGPVMDDIAADRDLASQYRSGLRDHEIRNDARADAMADELDSNANHAAAFLATLLINGGAR